MDFQMCIRIYVSKFYLLVNKCVTLNIRPSRVFSTSNCQCSLLSKKSPIIRTLCVSGWLAVPINPDKSSSAVYITTRWWFGMQRFYCLCRNPQNTDRNITNYKIPLLEHVTSKSLRYLYRVILSVLDPKKCEYLKDYSLDFEHAYMTTIYKHFQNLL
jgi:hypothetical protein